MYRSCGFSDLMYTLDSDVAFVNVVCVCVHKVHSECMNNAQIMKRAAWHEACFQETGKVNVKNIPLVFVIT